MPPHLVILVCFLFFFKQIRNWFQLPALSAADGVLRKQTDESDGKLRGFSGLRACASTTAGGLALRAWHRLKPGRLPQETTMTTGGLPRSKYLLMMTSTTTPQQAGGSAAHGCLTEHSLCILIQRPLKGTSKPNVISQPPGTMFF